MDESSPLHRYASETIGALVLAAGIIFLVALFQGGRVREWFNPGLDVRVILPTQGLFGLTEGADVEILGTPAGRVRRIVIQPDQQMFAEIYIDAAMSNFVRRDSGVTIRKRFGVAGETYMEIARGSGQPLDEELAVLEAHIERAPTETVGEMLSVLRERVLPVVDHAGEAMSALVEVAGNLRDPQGNLQQLLTKLSAISGKMERGEGTIGRLLTDAEMADDLEGVVARLDRALADLVPVIAAIGEAAEHASTFTEALAGESERIPRVAERLEKVLGALDGVLGDLDATLADVRAATPELPRISRNVAAASDDLPALVAQTRQTVTELQALVRQMRSSWLVGGAAPAPAPQGGTRIDPLSVTP